MNPDIVTLSRTEVFFVYSLLGVLTAATCCFWVAYLNEKRRRLFEQEMRQRRIIQLERCVEMYNTRDRLEETVRRQRADVSAVTLPITQCEHRERRRRFLPLESNANGPG